MYIFVGEVWREVSLLGNCFQVRQLFWHLQS